MRSRFDRDRIPWQRDEPDLEGSLAVSVTPAKPTAWGKPRFRNADRRMCFQKSVTTNRSCSSLMSKEYVNTMQS